MREYYLEETDFVIPFIIKEEGYFFFLRCTVEAVYSIYKPRRICIVSNQRSINILKEHCKNYEWNIPLEKLVFYNEDGFVPGVPNISELSKTYDQETSAQKKPIGWYYQQFIKLAPALRNDFSEVYIVWDADLIPLEPWALYYDGSYHIAIVSCDGFASFAESTSKNLKMDPYIEGETATFINHHMPFKRKYVKEMLEYFKTDSHSWWENILVQSKYMLFSEYLSYYVYVHYTYPGQLKHWPKGIHHKKPKEQPTRFIAPNSNKYNHSLTLRNIKLFSWDTILMDFNSDYPNEGIKYEEFKEYCINNCYIKESGNKYVQFEV